MEGGGEKGVVFMGVKGVMRSMGEGEGFTFHSYSVLSGWLLWCYGICFDCCSCDVCVWGFRGVKSLE